MHLNLEVWNTRTHKRRLQDQPCSSLSPSAPTCHIELDGVRGGPPPQRLVRLKPEVVVACITQLRDPNLDRAAGIAAPYVAGTQNSSVIVILHVYSEFHIPCRVYLTHRVRPWYDRLIWLGSVWWTNSLRPSADTRNHMTRFTVWPAESIAELSQTHRETQELMSLEPGLT